MVRLMCMVSVGLLSLGLRGMELDSNQKPNSPEMVFAESKWITPTLLATEFDKNFNNPETLNELGKYVRIAEGYQFAKKLFPDLRQARPVVTIEPFNIVPSQDAVKNSGTRLSGFDDSAHHLQKTPKEPFVGKSISVDCKNDQKSRINKITAQISGNEVKVITAMRDADNPTVTSNIEWTIAPLDETKKEPSAIAIDPYSRNILVGTNHGLVSIYSADSQKEERVLKAHTGKVTDIALFCQGSCFVTKDDKCNTFLWAASDTHHRLRLNDIPHGHDYVFDGGIVRSHYGESSKAWIPNVQLWVTGFKGSDGNYEIPLNYLKGKSVATPALIYSVLLQWLMLQKSSNSTVKDLVRVLPQAQIRNVIEKPVLESFELALEEQAKRLNVEYKPYSPFAKVAELELFSIEKK